ncbi:MAG: FKBP-type peptidyl-prolyl cis-trans isomerase N-terminal domain-containing protein [Thiomicrorhabdus sp.]|nr:FKBP-type peptidyl-prolyl cis-trans isomerase N-terminal domain-containing protein [Thiomicrorhabdus sp.]
MSHNYTSSADIVSYGIGRQMGDQLASDPFEGVNAEAVAAGVLDALSGVASPIDDAGFAKDFQEIIDIMQVYQSDNAQAAAAYCEAFFAENA